MIIQELTQLYGDPIKGRDNMVRWVIRGKDGIEVSIAHSPRHACTDNSAEVAYVRKGKIISPSDVTDDQSVLTHFDGDVIAEWCILANIQQIVAAIQ